MSGEVFKTIYSRRSTRSYLDRQIETDELLSILDAGLWAPTARNEQEIKMTVVQDKELMSRFKADFVKAGARSPRFDNFDYNAPTFIFMFGPKDFPYTELDTGIVAENMALAAESLGLGTVMIGCIREFMRSEAAKPWRDLFGMTDDDIFTLGLAVGRIDKKTQPRERKGDRIKLL